MTRLVTPKMMKAATQAETAEIDASVATRGRKVRIKVGKYAGRMAIIDGASIDARRGRWLFCCMVLRTDMPIPLNGDGESRQYRPQDEFEVIE